jgi:hypothetical protein
VNLLRAWLIGTGVLLAGALVWALAPILVPLVLVFVGLGAIVALIVWLARAYERRWKGGSPRL